MHGRLPSAVIPTFLNASLDGLDAAIRRRIELHLSKATRAAGASGWALGLLNEERDLTAFYTSGQIEIRDAFTLLCLVPFPQSAGPVEIKVTPREDVFDAIGISVELGENVSLAIVFAKPQLEDATHWDAVDAIQSCAGALAQEMAGLAQDCAGPNPAATVARDPCAFFLLSAALDVKIAWNADDEVSKALAELVRSDGERLPLFLERAIRRLISAWNFSAFATCTSGVAYPVRGLSLRVAPMMWNEIFVGVFLSAYEDAHDTGTVAASFGISPREMQVLHELLDGRSVAEIARTLGLAESTVNDHIARMIGKTHARNRTEMIAVLLGWPATKAKRSTNGEAPGDGRTDAGRLRSLGFFV